MSSSINEAWPQAGNALTANVRSNFAAAKAEIEALQLKATGLNAAGTALDGVVIGGETPAAGTFTDIIATGNILSNGVVTVSQTGPDPLTIERTGGFNKWTFRTTAGGLTGLSNQALIIKPSFGASAGEFAIKTSTADSGTADLVISTTGDVGIGIAPVTGARLLLPQENDPVTPTLAFGDGDTGFYEQSDDILELAIGGVVKAELAGTFIGSRTGGGWRLFHVVASATLPPYAFSDDPDTGMGSAALDQLSLIAGSVEGIRIEESAGIIKVAVGSIVSPDGTLHVHTASAGAVTAHNDADEGVFENSAAGGISILTPNASDSNIYFGSSTTNVGAFIRWKYDFSALIVSTLKAGSNISIQGGSAATGVSVDDSTTAGDTRFLVYDVDNATLERVTVGAADSGGTNFKVLRIPN